MAITKLMHMKESSLKSASIHLKNCIKYIENEDKTEHGMYIAANNCHLETAFEEMIETKKYYGKEDKRQGYHFVISFKPGETDESTAFDIAHKFVREYLKDYEAVYSVHNDQKHIHAHIVFNSVNCMTGLKYHYNDGDWERDIQPIVDRLCIEHGLSPLEYHIDEYVGKDGQIHEKRRYSQNVSWNAVMQRDIDECIEKSKDFKDFLKHLKEDFNYTINVENRKDTTIKAPGMKKNRRLKGTSIGEDYSEAAIRMRIAVRNGKYIYERCVPPEIIKISRMPKQQYIKFIKWDKMTPFQRERLKAMMIRRQLSITNGPLWYKKAKASEFNKAVENYQYIMKLGLKSERDALKRYYNINEKILINTKKRYFIRQEIRRIKQEAMEMDKSSEEYLKLIEQVKAAADEAEICKENIKNLTYEKYRCKRLLSEDVSDIVGRHDDIMYKNWKLEKDIHSLEKDIESSKKENSSKKEKKHKKDSSDAKDTGKLDITISKELIFGENDSSIKTRVPGTWGNNVRYIWIDKDKAMEIHNGKTILTFLESDKEYELYSEDNGVIETIKGEDLYKSHYDPVSKKVRRSPQNSK